VQREAGFHVNRLSAPARLTCGRYSAIQRVEIETCPLPETADSYDV
jgi:hypothetical protein